MVDCPSVRSVRSRAPFFCPENGILRTAFLVSGGEKARPMSITARATNYVLHAHNIQPRTMWYYRTSTSLLSCRETGVLFGESIIFVVEASVMSLSLSQLLVLLSVTHSTRSRSLSLSLSLSCFCPPSSP